MTINNATTPAARHNARSYALQAMYQWQISQADLIDIENEFIHHQINKKIDLAYFRELIKGVPTQLDNINEAIKPCLKRSINEIDPIETAVLRLATYELMHRPDIPYRVIINEALELTKTYGSSEGYKFINGILDKLAKTLRETEIKMDR